MRVLALETSADPCSLALQVDDALVVEIGFEHQMRLLEQLVDRADGLLRRHDCRLDQMDLLTVDVGPGSFTGLRVGVMTVKAWATVLAIPVIGVTSLEAVATEQEPVADEGVLVLLRARYGWLYSQWFRCRGESMQPEAEPSIVAVEGIAQHLADLGADRMLVAGDGLVRHGDQVRVAIAELGIAARFGTTTPPGAATIARIAARERAAGQEHDALGLVPLYVAEPAIGPRRS